MYLPVAATIIVLINPQCLPWVPWARLINSQLSVFCGQQIDYYKVIHLLTLQVYNYHSDSHLQIDKKAMHKAGMVQRVTNEVEIHCRLKHPSILEVIIHKALILPPYLSL